MIAPGDSFVVRFTPPRAGTFIYQHASATIYQHASATWRPIAKDGAPLPAAESVAGPARQMIAVGEICHFEFQAPAGRKTAWLESAHRRWQVSGTGQVIIK